MIDWNTILLAIVAGIPAMLVALATLITAIKNKNAVVELAKSVDGHMTNLLAQVKLTSKLEGKTEGLAEGIVKGAELNKTTVITDRRDPLQDSKTTGSK